MDSVLSGSTGVKTTGHPQPNRRTILVTDAGRGSAISIIRSLGSRGWTVIAADADPHSPGFRSRYASRSFVYPQPEVAPQAFVDALLQYIADQAVDLLIPVTDNVILPILKARSEFEQYCKPALPESDALLTTMDKNKTLALAEQLGVPIPTTRWVHTVQEAVAAAQAFDWPVVIKPQLSRLYQGQAGIAAFKVSYALDAADLAAQMQRYEGVCPVLLQEYHRGVGYGVELLMDKGRPLAAFQHKRLREVPLTGGVSTFREGVPLDPAMYDYALRLLGHLQWTGLAMVEFKAGEAGPKLMEINGRIWGSLPLAVHSGMDFPLRLAEYYLAESPPLPTAPAVDYATGVRSRNLELDIGWMLTLLMGKQHPPFVDVPPRREAFKAFLGLFNPRDRFDILSWRDPRPGLAEIAKIARKLYRKSQQELA